MSSSGGGTNSNPSGGGKGVKLSLGEFMGGGSGDGPPPSGPRGGGYGDRDSAGRRPYGVGSDGTSRGDQDGGSWRRGGAATGGGRFSDSSPRDGDDRGYRSYGGDRGGGGDRGSYRDRSDDRGSSYGNRGGGGGYRDDRDRDRDGGGSWRGGGGGPSRFGGASGGGLSSSRFERGGGGYGDRGDGPAGSSGPPQGERPRLQLKQRSTPRTDGFDLTVADATTKLQDLDVAAPPGDGSEAVGTADGSAPEPSATGSPNRPRREPEVVNPRAAALESLGSSSNRDRRERGDRPADRGPPPVRNKMFEQLAEEERATAASLRRDDRDRERDHDPTSSSFRRGPPPPVANSRFAAVAEADRSSAPYDRDRERGPPPVANSRFATAAAMAEEERPPYRGGGDDYDRGPPPVANSRFASAAAQAAEESAAYEQRRRDRDQWGDGEQQPRRSTMPPRDHHDRGPPPVPQNSRFAAAVAADSDYMDRDERERRRMDRDEYREGRDRRSSGRDGPFHYQDRGALPKGPRGEDYGGNFEEVEQRVQEQHNRVADVLKPKAPPPTENILQFPTKAAAPEHAANMLKVPEKVSKHQEANVLVPPKKADKPKETVPKSEPEAAVAESSAPSVNSEEVMAEFVSGKRLGDELKVWTEANRASLPALETLVFELLKEHEKLNPDPNCAWAEPAKFGAALSALVEDDIVAQMRVLWGIQFYCEKLGFPKLNNESVVQSMFRAMYKYDLADSDAFLEWKEDESDAYSKGKLNAVIQTVDWFNWLEADDEDEEGDEDEE